MYIYFPQEIIKILINRKRRRRRGGGGRKREKENINSDESPDLPLVRQSNVKPNLLL